MADSPTPPSPGGYVLLYSLFPKAKAHDLSQAFISSISSAPREGFVVLRRCLKTRAGGFPKGGKAESIGRRLLSLFSEQAGRGWG